MPVGELNYNPKLRELEERCVDDFLIEKDTLLHTSQEEKIKVIGERYGRPQFITWSDNSAGHTLFG